MSLEIIGAGFGRTGTASLKLALEQLGFAPTHHMFEVADNPATQLPHWEALARGETVDWDAIFDGYKAQVDWPGAFAWKELAAHFPDAKILLSVRDAEGWFRSAEKTIIPGMAARGTRDSEDRNRVAKMAYELIWAQTFDGKLDDHDHAIKVFNDHIAEVQAYFPAERLLTFDVREGWEPLCRFLNVDIPDTPFPRSNSTKEFSDRMDLNES